MLRPRQTGTGSGSRTPVIDECLGCISGAGSAGPRLRSQEGGKGGGGFRAAREGFLVFAFNARSGAVPLPLPLAMCGVVEDGWGNLWFIIR